MESAEEQKQEKRRFFDYRWIVMNFRFILFLAGLAVLYIANGHYADRTVLKINRTANKLKELQFEYKTVKSELMFRSKQSELVKSVGELGLEELKEPPVKLNP